MDTASVARSAARLICRASGTTWIAQPQWVHAKAFAADGHAAFAGMNS